MRPKHQLPPGSCGFYAAFLGGLRVYSPSGTDRLPNSQSRGHMQDPSSTPLRNLEVEGSLEWEHHSPHLVSLQLSSPVLTHRGPRSSHLWNKSPVFPSDRSHHFLVLIPLEPPLWLWAGEAHSVPFLPGRENRSSQLT